MTTISASIHIWVKTALINFLLMLLGAIVSFRGGDVLWAFVTLLVGIIATIPLLVFINPIVVLSKRITHYGIPARIASLTFHLMLMVLLFFLLASLLSTETLFVKNPVLADHMACTMVSLMISVYINRRSLKALYEEK
ncbi:hypothetical protein [Niastella populi]|uniref:Uncharacterized protein n=1 Tax=Niastella populi TaxID=550983 RepID=A0A1V9FK75_9BACT|nr:hypothetical protein [Niastella populi]OQP58626.1 hypothetical protein A4R26_04020 [Niastella populi]